MYFILHFLIVAAVIFLLARFMDSIHVSSYGKALLVAVLIAFFNTIIGWIPMFVGNLFTLFLLKGIIRILVTALMIKLVDKLMGDFEVKGFGPAILIAVVLAVVGYFFDRATADEVSAVINANLPIS